MRNGVVVDSGPLLALFDRDDAHHARVRQALERNQGLRLLTTWPVLTETSALLASRVGKDTEIEFLDWVAAGGMTVVPLDNADLDAMIGLLRKYRDLPFDFADTSVAALAASLGVNRVLSVDRDFEVYRAAGGRPLQNLLTLPLTRRYSRRRVP
ncbi:MAG: PIN domain-containing protein [Betaproteobacteria bacterium]|nr:PIN domain-containing protein [Betaproteobacteria bacterium]